MGQNNMKKYSPTTIGIMWGDIMGQDGKSKKIG
jgi:hypothetical protein